MTIFTTYTRMKAIGGFHALLQEFITFDVGGKLLKH